MMMLWENVKIAINGIFTNKMRSILTMLGIIIGIGSVISIFTMGDSLQKYMSSTMQSMGANNITVMVRSKANTRYSNNQMKASDYISIAHITALQEAFPDQIDSFSLSQTVGNGSAKYGVNSGNISFVGVNDNYFKNNTVELEQGRFFNQTDVENERHLVVISSKLVEYLQLINPIGQSIDLYVNNILHSYTVIGVYKYSASGFNMSNSASDSISTQAYIPMTQAEMISGISGYQSLTLVTKVGVNSTEFAVMVQNFLNRFYVNNSNFEITSSSMESLVDTVLQMVSTIQLVISAIAAISLLVGGIGVMNIMLVSITERTKEIGIRKALGARNFDIRFQFITEAAILCLIGGAIGILLGVVLGMVGSNLLGYPGQASLFNIAVAAGFSLLVGIFFGYYPANKAAKLDPIEALRYE